MLRRMHRAALLLALCVSACSSESSPGPVTDTDASTATDTSSASDTRGASEVTSPTGDTKACPVSAPDDQAPCDSPGQLCEYPIDCGPNAGTFATCTNAKWNVVKRPCTTGDTGPRDTNASE